MTSSRVVAIDGPSGVGKSTVATRCAERLALTMLDTGAMYRAIGLACLEASVDVGDEAAVLAHCDTLEVDLRRNDDGKLEVHLNGRPVARRIRTREVSDATSRVAAYPGVRRRMVKLQRQVASRRGIVVEGRDIGTVVFPETPHKFFLTARPEVRARRRMRDHEAAGRQVSFDDVLADIQERDARDSNRPDSPLHFDDTYVVIDTSDVSIDQVVDQVVQAVQSATSAA